ncbi:MAG TPA: hypothetical protein VMP11_18515 [Verrucomicrobiae bacterium]|nr:hypothetical protein [Verrucomicrobiae bacterium]
MSPYFRCRHCKKRLVPLVQSFAHHLWGRERICPRCGKIWRLTPGAQQSLMAFGVVVGLVLTIELRQWFPAVEDTFMLVLIWLPLYVFVVWPAMFALLGNYRMK